MAEEPREPDRRVGRTSNRAASRIAWSLVVLSVVPDGRLPSPRWRPVAWGAGLGITGSVLGYALYAGLLEDFPQLHGGVGRHAHRSAAARWE